MNRSADAGRVRTNLRAVSAAAVVVRIAVGFGVGQNGRQTFSLAGQGGGEQGDGDPAGVDRGEEMTYSTPCGAQMATRSPGWVTCCNRAPMPRTESTGGPAQVDVAASVLA